MSDEQRSYFVPPAMPWAADAANLPRYRELYAKEVAYYREHQPEHLAMAAAHCPECDVRGGVSTPGLCVSSRSP